MKRYGRSMLSEDQIRLIVNAKLEGKLTNREIASVQRISIRRVQQIYSEHKTAHCMFRKRLEGMPLPEQVKCEIIKLHKMYRANASYMAKFSERKDTTLTTTGSIKYSRRLVLQ